MVLKQIKKNILRILEFKNVKNHKSINRIKMILFNLNPINLLYITCENIFNSKSNKFKKIINIIINYLAIYQNYLTGYL